MLTLGFDTSNYTTSCAFFDGTEGENFSRLLDVAQGELGLRQSDALFAHINRLPDLSDGLFAHIGNRKIDAIGVSTRPRSVEGSYMPCFLAGVSQARVLASALHVPLYEFSHQQGHIAAALWSAGRTNLISQPFLAWHLSGGTTEFLSVEPDEDFFRITKIGGTTDISAGQLIDRTGKLLGLRFPSGKELDGLAAATESSCCFKVKVNGGSFSFSGVQNQVESFRSSGAGAEDTARFCLLSVCGAIRSATRNMMKQYPGRPVLFSGGVASNSLLRKTFAGSDFIFAEPRFSTDNAMGIAILANLRRNQ